LIITTPRTQIWAGNPLRPVGQILRGEAPTLVGPSGIPAPTGDLPGWALIEAEGFDVPVPAGNWPTHPHYRPRWRTYSPGTHDTAPGKGLYDAARTTTVAGSCLKANLHYEAGTDDQVVSLQTYSTIADATSNVHAGQTFGRYSICMRATYTGSGVAGAHKVVPLLWPRTLPWPDGGETDFPECAITPTAVGTAFVHYANPSGGQDVRTSTGLISDWHVWTTEWKPNLIRVFMDGVQVGNDCITDIPAAEMRWTLQFETQITGLRTATSATNVLTSTAHGYTDGMAVKFEALGAATGVSLGTYYYVVGSTTNTFQLSATRGGSPITLGTASGVTVRRWPAPDDSALVEVDWSALYRYVP
jgi:hypothetical protein